MPYTSRLDMMEVSRAPLATATRAIALNSQSGTATPLARTTSSSGPEEADSSPGGTTSEAVSPTST